jgi:hypothetical protein
MTDDPRTPDTAGSETSDTQNIAALLTEQRRYQPPADIAAAANAKPDI